MGRVDREKCLDVIIRAVYLLDRNDIHFVIAGNGAAKDNLMELVKSLGLQEKVRFTGFIPNSDLPSVLNSIDIFTMPGVAELLSIASLQAMACARPMLVANAVALPELVTEDSEWFAFSPWQRGRCCALHDCSCRPPRTLGIDGCSQPGARQSSQFGEYNSSL